jgi:23S rRNA pseudouridine1911/1915/1917 synthase
MLDGALRVLAEVPWSEARRLIETGKVSLAGAPETNAHRRVRAGQPLEIRLRTPRPRTARIQELGEDLIAYVDPAVVVVRKPAGISTVPFGDEVPEEEGPLSTLDALVREVLARRDKIRGRAPLGVVQRLDKATSGLLVFSRTVAAKKHLAQQLRERSMHRLYLAIAHGDVPARTMRSHLIENRGDGLRGSIQDALGPRARSSAPRGRFHGESRQGQLAVTHVEPVERLRGATLIACRLETGRTHQIRIHLSESGHPLIGETVYIRDFPGARIPAPRLMLHAGELGFEHPIDNRPMLFKAPPPADFEEVLSRLRG